MDLVHFEVERTHEDNEFGIGIRQKTSKWSTATCHYITFKAGQTFMVKIFPGQAVKILDCPGKIGTDGHLSLEGTSMYETTYNDKYRFISAICDTIWLTTFLSCRSVPAKHVLSVSVVGHPCSSCMSRLFPINGVQREMGHKRGMNFSFFYFHQKNESYW